MVSRTVRSSIVALPNANSEPNRLGEARKIADVTTWNAVDVDGEESPVAKFTFRYCSRSK